MVKETVSLNIYQDMYGYTEILINIINSEWGIILYLFMFNDYYLKRKHSLEF